MGNIPHTAPVTSVFAASSDNRASRFDPSVPHLARVYAYWLGGKDHFPADRMVAEDVAEHRPQVVTGARANRKFQARVVDYLARGPGIRQFLDVGAGLPAPGCTHEIAQAVAPQSRVVYADRDDLVLARARARLTGGTRQGAIACAQTDLRDPAGVLAAAGATLDFTQPAAVLLLAVLHFIRADEDPAAIVAALASGLAPGSFIAISHVTADFAPQEVGAALDTYNALMPTPVTARTHRRSPACLAHSHWSPPGWCPSPDGAPARWRSTPASLTCTADWPAPRRADGHEHATGSARSDPHLPGAPAPGRGSPPRRNRPLLAGHR